jgi:hypothetical protein
VKLKPPKTNNEYFIKVDFEKYSFARQLIGFGQEYPILPLWFQLHKKFGFEKSLEIFLTLWPAVYQDRIKEVFSKIV